MKKQEHSSWKNINAYRKGKEKLENAIAQHPEEDPKTSVYDFMKRNIKRRMWVIPYEKFKKGDK